MIDGRYHASIEDVVEVATPVLRHRIVRTFEAETDNLHVEEIIRRLVATVPVDPMRTEPVRVIPSFALGRETPDE